jgi:hypothetical protein
MCACRHNEWEKKMMVEAESIVGPTTGIAFASVIS